jgi:hypothetical protein
MAHGRRLRPHRRRACGVIEILVEQLGCGWDLADSERVLLHAIEGGHKRSHVRDFTRNRDL